jgi:hypothetical protein
MAEAGWKGSFDRSTSMKREKKLVSDAKMQPKPVGRFQPSVDGDLRI